MLCRTAQTAKKVMNLDCSTATACCALSLAILADGVMRMTSTGGTAQENRVTPKCGTTTEMTDHAPVTLQADETAPRGSVQRIVNRFRRQQKYYRLNAGQRRRLDWLIQWPQMWQGYRLNKRTIVCVFQLMQASGLYSRKTNWFDSGVPRLVRRAKAANDQAQRPPRAVNKLSTSSG